MRNMSSDTWKFVAVVAVVIVLLILLVPGSLSEAIQSSWEYMKTKLG